MALSWCSLCTLLVAAALVSGVAAKEKDVTKLQIGVKFRPEKCDVKAHNGDNVKVHYKGTLTDGTVFDSSYERGEPIDFVLGQGNVIKGWDLGILGMCIGEKRKLKIPSDLGYGDSGSPPKIPGGATLIFETELVDVGAAPPEPEGMEGMGGMESMEGMGDMDDMEEPPEGYGEDYEPPEGTEEDA